MRYRSGAIAAAEPKASTSALPFWALMSFTFVLLIGPQWYVAGLASFRLALITAAVGIASCLFEKIKRHEPIIGRTREMRIVACLVGWAVLTVPLSYWPGGSVSLLLDLYFKALVVFWLISNVVNTRSRLRQIVWGLSLMAVPLAFTGVKQYLSGEFIARTSVTRIVGYAAPLTANPNDLALMLNLILPLVIALFLSIRKPVLRTVLLGIIALLVVGVILTFSRAGFLTVATIFVMYLWKLRKRPQRGWAVAALVIALLCIPLLPSSYFERMSTITAIQTDPTGSAQGRWIDTVVAANFVLKNPIVGAGVGMSILALNEERGMWWKTVHNVYLQYGMDLGIPGLVLFVMLLAGCIKSATYVQRRCAGVPAFRELFYLAEGIQVSLVAFAVAGLFHPVAYHFYFYYIAGLAVSLGAVYTDEEHKCATAG